MLDWIKSKSLYLYFFLALGLVVRLGRFDDSIFEMHSFRQTQTAFLIRNLANDNYNLVRAELPVLGYPWQVPLEFPIFQTGAAYLMNTLGWDSSYSGRFLSTFAFLTSAAGLFYLSKMIFGMSVARIALPIFLFTSFAFQWGSAVVNEWLPVSLAILSFIFVHKFLNSDNLYKRNSFLLLSMTLMSLAALAKITTALVWIVAILGYVVFEERKTFPKKFSYSALVFITLGTSLVPSMIWNRFADGVKSSNPFTVWLTSDNLQIWNFGTLQQRLDMSNWKIIYDRIEETMLGAGLVLVAMILLMALSKSKSSYNSRWIMLAVMSGPIVFFNLYLVHDYYLVAIYPLIIILASMSIDFLVNQTKVSSFAAKGAFVGVILTGTFMSQIGSGYMKNFIQPGGVPAASKIIANNTLSQDQIIVIGCDWDPTNLYFADRKGLMLMPGRYSDADLKIELLSDYRYVYLCNGASADILPKDIGLEPVIENLYKLSSYKD